MPSPKQRTLAVESTYRVEIELDPVRTLKRKTYKPDVVVPKQIDRLERHGRYSALRRWTHECAGQTGRHADRETLRLIGAAWQAAYGGIAAEELFRQQQQSYARYESLITDAGFAGGDAEVLRSGTDRQKEERARDLAFMTAYAACDSQSAPAARGAFAYVSRYDDFMRYGRLGYMGLELYLRRRIVDLANMEPRPASQATAAPPTAGPPAESAPPSGA